MTEFKARTIEAVVFIVVILAAQLLHGCAALRVQATPQGVNATYVRIGDQDLSGLQIERNETGSFRVQIERQKATGEAITEAVRATLEAMP